MKGFTVEQEFTSSRANLSAIEILFGTHGKEGVDSNLTIKLISKGTGATLRAASINSISLKDNQWYNWEFSPLNDSANEKYILKIDGDGRPGRSVTIWMNSKKPDNSTGGLYINGAATIGSLCFGTYYNLKTAFH